MAGNIAGWFREQFLQSETQETRSSRFVDGVQDVQRSKVWNTWS